MLNQESAFSTNSTEENQRLQFALQAAGIGTWDLDIIHQQVWWDERCKELYGFCKDAVVSYDQVLSYMHKEDQQRVDQAVQWALNPASGGQYMIEFRTIGAEDKRLRLLRCQGKAYFDERGVAYRFSGIAQDITEEKKLAEDLEQQQLQLQTILDHLPVGILIADATEKLLYGNPQMERMFMHTLRESKDLEFYQTGQLFDPLTNDPIALEQIPMVRTLRHAETVEGVEVKLRRADHTWAYASVNSVPVLNAQGKVQLGVAAFIDTTQRKRAEEDLRKNETLLRSVLESILDGVYIGGMEGISLANQVALDQLGYATREDLNRNIATLAQEIQTRDYQTRAIIPASEQAFAKALGGQRIIQDVLVRHRTSQQERVVRCAAAPVLIDGKVVAAVAVNTDVTEIKQAEEALRLSKQRYKELASELEQRVEERTHALVAANYDLKRSNDHLQQFAYVASHDLQEPLRKIQVFTRLLAREEVGVNEKASHHLSRIQAATSRMSSLIKDLLSYSQVVTRQQDFTQVSINAILDQVLDTLSIPILERKAQITVDAPITVVGDELHLHQLFQNLLSNALKIYTPRKGTCHSYCLSATAASASYR
ncbi:hypothetical protein BWI97_25800 [Siphonobacter sp. BAB-5405]|uniref:PAS domain-containing sensor histidine kinase n=1 Tax=Siphonobacter sp. BAB-5405 TaxID=1864825 RepID=UPI000C7F8C40|nr:PAS domain-containing protein [Siphonobacter sp. BAB-5405]PMD87437.1 hypothetical protein BWI97_25800 [Siphonobacter sp. BAB-5405]